MATAIASLLAEEFPDILDALSLLLVLAHHAEGRRQELLAVLHLNCEICVSEIVLEKQMGSLQLTFSIFSSILPSTTNLVTCTSSV